MNDNNMQWNRSWTRMFDANKLPQKQSNMSGFLGIGQMALSGASGLLNFFDRKASEERQHKRQKELMDRQQKNQMALNRQGQELSMDLWNKTNYGAQMEHLKEAGLNPALMYGSAGQGGSTVGSGGGSASGGQAGMGAPMDIGSLLGSLKMKEELELLRAEKGKTEEEGRKAGAEANVIEETGVEEAGSRIALNMSAVGVNISQEDLNHANVLVAGSNLAVNDGKINLMLTEEALNKARAELSRSGIDVNKSIVDLNRTLSTLNTTKNVEAIQNIQMNAMDIARMSKLGFGRIDGHAAKTVKYLSEATGIPEGGVIGLIGGTLALEKLVSMIPVSWLQPASKNKGVGKGEVIGGFTGKKK